MKVEVIFFMAKTNKIKVKKSQIMDNLLLQGEAKPIPKAGELVEGTVINMSKNEVQLDLDGLTTGVVRGKEIYDESGEYSDVKIGDRVSATVLEIENEQGQIELSFRYAGHQKAWQRLEELERSGEAVEAKVIDANKGGLMIRLGNVIGFMPVSQLTTEHYPRVEGGDKSRILVALKKFVNKILKVKVIDVKEGEEKLIVSEKAAWEEKQNKALANFKVGDLVEGKITGVVDFGAFVEFGENLEGLIHISELAWQRIDDPKQIVKVGDKVKAKIIAIEDSKISLSLKQLMNDPWKDVNKKYQVGQQVTGKVLKLNPFGAFVELDKDIHGLIHISELSDKQLGSPDEVIKEGETGSFVIISIEPESHRLGLSLKKTKEKKKESAEAKTETADAAAESGLTGEKPAKAPAKKPKEKKMEKKEEKE
jgi:small subunit ribosomal protein S1